MKQKVVVVGGSVAGLTMANLLRDGGYEVDVYERSPSTLAGFGTGIVVQPELVRYPLERAGVSIEQISVGSNTMQYFSASSGDALGSVPSIWRFTTYNAIYGCLLRKFGVDRYHLGHTLTDICETDDKAFATFENGAKVAADLIVCADGGRSVARQKLLDIMPSYAGYVTWRGMVDQREVSAETWDFFKQAFTYGLLHDSHIIAYPVPEVLHDGQPAGGVRLNWQWYWNVATADLSQLMTDVSGIERPVTLHSEMIPSATMANFRGRTSGELSKPFAELLLSSAKPFVTLVSDTEVPKMAFERIALIGDAAFAPRPHAAAGAAKACDDAWNLATELTLKRGEIKAALLAWEPRQLEVGRSYLSKVRSMGDVLQHGGHFPPGAEAYRFGLPQLKLGSKRTSA